MPPAILTLRDSVLDSLRPQAITGRAGLGEAVCPWSLVQILVGNKCDVDENQRMVPFSKGQALANEFGIKFFETSAKSNTNVEEVGRCV